MIYAGIDIGTSAVKAVVTEEKRILETYDLPHHGRILETLLELTKKLCTFSEHAVLSITGSNSRLLGDLIGLESADEIPAIMEGARQMFPGVGSIIEIGSQNSRFITDLDRKVPRFAVNEHCAGGTGSFFEDQMTRLGYPIEQYSEILKEAHEIPRLSGRCSVFAKTDIIHRQQEGSTVPDILLGLCYAMIRNFKAVIVRDLPVKKPVVYCGGVTKNTGTIAAIREVFGLREEEFVIPPMAVFAAALGSMIMGGTETDLLKLTGLLIREISFPEDLSDDISPLVIPEDLMQKEPEDSLRIPPEGCYLGIDIGSTSTNLVLTAEDGTLIHHQYLRTKGNPLEAVRTGLSEIRKQFGPVQFRYTGITGSGRERIGRLLGLDVIKDEITAQAYAAKTLNPCVDTVFEIGGQDSKFISLKNGEVADFQMNKICAAGTGSFVEEQAAAMKIPLSEFGQMALRSSHPALLGDRCTVFIKTAISSAESRGRSMEDIAAGICYAIVRNYLNKVVGNKKTGEQIVLQGGVAYNPGIAAAFYDAYPGKLTISPYFPISGAYGVSLLARDLKGEKISIFHGFEEEKARMEDPGKEDAKKENIRFYERSKKLLLEGYDGKLDPSKKTVGIPYALMIHKFFPMANAFFKSLGFNVLLSDSTNEETIRLSQQYASGETCYPVKLIYGHMKQLIDQKVDYIFFPSVRTMKHESSKVKNNYGCVFMQTAGAAIAESLNLREKGIELLNPVFDLDFGKEAMASAMIGLASQIKKPKPLCMKALLSGAMAVRKHTEAVEKQGKALLKNLNPSDKVLVLITRNYGIADPVLNMGIPDLLLERGYKIMTLSHLPAHDLDLSADYPDLYWPFGQHIISGIKMVAHHPNLYAVFLTNHGCGPDSMIAQMVRTEMGGKPYLQIEVDEHFSRVGVITRVEAFLNSIEHRTAENLPDGFDVKNVPSEPVRIRRRPEKEEPLFLPPMGIYTRYLSLYLKTAYGIDARNLRWDGVRQMDHGRAETNAKEYVPFTAMLDCCLKTAEETKGKRQFLIPASEGADADGMYARGIRSVLDRKGYDEVTLYSPVLETLPETEKDLELLIRAILTGDLLYAAPVEQREQLAPDTIPGIPELLNLAEKISSFPVPGRILGACGTPLCLTVLDDGILETLEQEGETIFRAPVSEALLFLWMDKYQGNKKIEELRKLAAVVTKVSGNLKSRNSFSSDPDKLRECADRELFRFAGANGRYRFAKAMEYADFLPGVLTLSPRYENTAAVLDLKKMTEKAKAPLFQISLDGDWDESSWSRLHSFLYFCH